MKNFDNIKRQMRFCSELVLRLEEDINTSGEGNWGGMENHERKRDDIKRIRREFMTLSNMLGPYAK